MPAFQGQVGPVVAGAGSNPNVQQGRNAEIVTADFHGRKYTAAYNGSIYIASTGVAGVAPGTALSATPPMILWNPPGSNINCEILKTSVGFISGTLAAGTVFYLQGPQASKPTTGTALTAVSALLGNPKTGAGVALQASTVLAAGTVIRPGFTLGAIATGTGFGSLPTVEEIEGELILTPGNFFAMQAVAGAGTTPLVAFGLVWNEVPI